MILALALLAPIGQARALDRTPAEAQAASQQTEAPKPQPRVDRTRIPAAQADAVLGAGWRKSTDRAWTLVGSGEALHVLAAKKAEAFAWRTIATLSEPGFDTDAWVGNGCVTASGTRLVVVYAPKAFTNDEVARDRAAFTAVVDLRSGVVRKLAVTSTLAYFNPGCGSGETAVLAQYNHQGSAKTRLVRIDAADGTTTRTTISSGEVTSVDTREAFRNEGPCTGEAMQAINSFTTILTPGDEKEPSAESFHPNERGTQLYADTIETSLNWP